MEENWFACYDSGSDDEMKAVAESTEEDQYVPIFEPNMGDVMIFRSFVAARTKAYLPSFNSDLG